MDMDRIRIRESQSEYYNTRTATKREGTIIDTHGAWSMEPPLQDAKWVTLITGHTILGAYCGLRLLLLPLKTKTDHT